MFAKMVLPVLGGPPSVWSVSVFFFQAALLAGYLYAHLLINKVPAHLTGIVHLAVCVPALVCLPIGMATWVGEPPQGEPYLWQLGLFTVSIGPPFMAVSANAPLSAGLVREERSPDAATPISCTRPATWGADRAVGVSLHPGAGVRSEPAQPSVGLGVRAAGAGHRRLVLSDARRPGRRRAGDGGGALRRGDRDAGSGADLIDRLGWIGLAFVPAALLTAFTVHIATDVASAPLLWVFPLALYLLTFVLVFRDQPLISREALLFLHLVALVIALLALSQYTNSWFIVSFTGVVVFSPPRCWPTARFTRPVRRRCILPSSTCGCRSAARWAVCSPRWWHPGCSARSTSIRCCWPFPWRAGRVR